MSLSKLSGVCLCFCLFLTLTLRSQTSALPEGLYAQITTPKGILVLELYHKQAPLTVSSFVGLAEGMLGPKPGTPFFDGLRFHRVVPGFVIQGGDPLGTGEGGPGYSFPDEFVPGLRHDAAGVLSMANSGPDTNGSQFFITLSETQRLNYLHSVFGRVVQGGEILALIAKDDSMSVKIIRKGVSAEAFRVDPSSFAHLQAAAPRYQGLEIPGPGAAFDDPDKVLPLEPPRAVGFNHKLNNFRRATGLTVWARVYAHAPKPTAGAVGNIDTFASTLAGELKLGDQAALAVYFADADTWSFWCGRGIESAFGAGADEVRARFDGLRNAARSSAEKTLVSARKSLEPGKSLTQGQEIKARIDAALDPFLLALETKAVVLGKQSRN